MDPRLSIALRWLLLAWLMLHPAAAPGATALASYRAQVYDATAGLEVESLLHVTRLADGRILLVGVRGEPQLFDGHRFTALPLRAGELWTGNGAMATAQSPDGALWVAGASGLLRFADGRSQRLELPPNAAPFHVRLADDGQELLVPTRAGVLRVSVRPPHAMRALGPATLAATAVAQDRSGQWWIGTSNGLFLLGPDDTVQAHPDPRLRHVHVWALHVDRRGRVLVATRGLGLAILATGQPLAFLGPEQGLPHNTVRAIAETDDALWLATAGGGIARWDEQELAVFTSADGLSSDSTTWITADASGVLWVSTAGAGLNRLWPSPFTNLSYDSGRRGGFHYAVYGSADGRIWAGSNQGLSEVLGDRVVWIGAPGEGQSATVLGLLDAPDGGLYLASRRGLFHFLEGSGFRSVAHTEEWVNPGLWRSPRFGLLAATGERLFRLQPATPPELLLTLPVPEALIQTFADDPRYGLLLGTRDGVYAFDGHALTELGPRGRAVGGFWRDEERLYVSGNGLAALDAGGWHPLLPALESGPRSTWYNFAPDRLGGLWLTGRDGLLRLDRLALRRARDPQELLGARLFTLRDGLPSTEFEGSPQGTHGDAAGRLWLASTGGLVRLDPAVLGAPTPPLELAVRAVENETQTFDASADLVLPAGTRRIALALTALPASHAAAVQLRFRLLPLETEFRNDRGAREAVYGGLPPGTYALELEGEIAGLAPVRAQARYEFRIAPTLLQRTDVRFALASLLLLVLAAVPTWHIRALRAQRRALTARVAAQTASLEMLARTDGLTGLDNRRAFDEALKTVLDRATEDALPALLLLDVDHFKRLNDQLGHQAGDHCLRMVARTLKAGAPEGAQVARIGGEEFAVLLPGTVLQRESLPAVGTRLRQAIAALALVHPGAPGGHLTLSLGAARAVPGETPDTLLRRADEALYAAKRGGRDQLVLAAS